MNRSQFFYVLFSVVCIQACTQDNSSKSLEKPNAQVSAPPAEIAVTPEVAAVPETTIYLRHPPPYLIYAPNLTSH
ncbi:MAG: hypothetical protein ACO3O0_09740, partial [Bacteroidia bacterium]